MAAMTHVVIGAGEVGRAIAEVLAPRYETHLRDVESTGPSAADVLHICFPWSDRFEADVERYREQYRPSLVIVHSTVPVGTCDGLGVVHSPIRGRHPFLARSVRQFVKFFGGKDAGEAAAIFLDLGIEVEVTAKAATTEAGKLWELAQYGLAIAAEKAVFEYCEGAGLDFEVVYTAFVKTYNAGYTALGEPRFVRPVLRHVPGPIGGHCVVQGSLLLEHPLADLVAQAGVNDAVEALA